MSVKHNKKKNNNAGGGNAAMKKDIQDLKAAGESTAALLAMSFKAQIVQDRAAGTDAISDEMILPSVSSWRLICADTKQTVRSEQSIVMNTRIISTRG